MGWSCRAEAAETLHKWEAVCREVSGSANVWTEKDGRVFMFEESGREHDDGAITGSIMQLLGWTPLGNCKAVPAGAFRIEPDGSVKRAPKFLKNVRLS